jgi:hypothetical protein
MGATTPTHLQRLCLGETITAAGDDGGILGEFVSNPVDFVNERHGSILANILNEDDLRRLLGLPTSASAGEVKGRLAARALSKSNRDLHDNFGLMCGCGG